MEDQPGGVWLYKTAGDFYSENTITRELLGSTSTVLGTGFSNTDIITSAPRGHLSAAATARDYNGGGFTDWYLPSLEELKIMYFSKDIIDLSSVKHGGRTFAANWYWSSSYCIHSGTEDGAHAFNFEEERQFCRKGRSKAGIRVIRNF